MGVRGRFSCATGNKNNGKRKIDSAPKTQRLCLLPREPCHGEEIFIDGGDAISPNPLINLVARLSVLVAGGVSNLPNASKIRKEVG